ncbi:MAG TPA: hypothetical protein VGK48_21175 [Terriglobia bacterium]
MNTIYRTAIVTILVPLAIAFLANAQEKKIQRSGLPAAVQKTVDEQSKGATIKGYSAEVEGGKTTYEVELTVNGHGKDISMDAQGHILEIEEETRVASLPAPVKDGLAKAAGAGTILKVESLTKNGKLVAYEAVVKSGNKNSEIQVGPDGKALAHPE